MHTRKPQTHLYVVKGTRAARPHGLSDESAKVLSMCSENHMENMLHASNMLFEMVSRVFTKSQK